MIIEKKLGWLIFTLIYQYLVVNPLIETKKEIKVTVTTLI